jgi:glycosyltransferase involved in cell wall biosynthesis
METSSVLENRDFVIVGQQPWDVEIGSNCKNIALELSKHNRVLYVNSALDRFTLLKGKNNDKVRKRMDVIQHKIPGLIRLKDRLWNLYPDCMVESITWLKSRPIFNALNRRNNRLFAQSIMKAMAELGFKDVILFNDNDMFRSHYLKELLKPKVSIYYSRDFMLGVDYWKFHGSILEPKLIAKSDICMANSTYLADYCRKYNPNSVYVGQGCDLDMFSNPKDTTLPADLANVARPIIGYVGALQSIRLDIAVIAEIAENNPDKSIVLVGPEDDAFKASRLHQIPNIVFTGGKPPDMLPAYINGFDVCINPQLVNPVTIGNYPRKIDEYLAMGKPVVATKTEAMGIFAQHTYLATSGKEYTEFINSALAENDPNKSRARREFAATHTWENNIKEIYRAINAYETTSHP